MEIHNILIVSPMYEALRAIIEKEQLPNQFRYSSDTEFYEGDLAWADALVTFNLHANLDYSHLKWVHSLGAGVDRFLYQKSWNDSVLLTRTICSFGQRIAEYCLSYILKEIQFHEDFQKQQGNRKWEQKTPGLLQDQSVLVFGTGEIGQTVARILSSLGVKVYGESLSGKQKSFFHEVFSCDEVFSRVGEMNFIINTMPLTEKTALYFDSQFFSHLTGAGFINVGRGASLDETALLRAIEEHRVKFAVLDVFSQEPLPKESPLWAHPNVMITPHISALTTPVEGATCFIETLRNIELDQPLKNIVDITKGY